MRDWHWQSICSYDKRALYTCQGAAEYQRHWTCRSNAFAPGLCCCIARGNEKDIKLGWDNSRDQLGGRNSLMSIGRTFLVVVLVFCSGRFEAVTILVQN